MAVPKRRTSKSVTRSRRSHHSLPTLALVTCSNCQELKRPHLVCPKCGYYQGKEIIKTED